MQSNKQHLLLIILLFLAAIPVFSQEDNINDLPASVIQDAPLPVKIFKDTITAPEIPSYLYDNIVAQDSIIADSLNKKQPLLLDQIKYKATDYAKLSQKDQKIYLYNNAEIYYQDTELKAGIIIMDYIKNEVYAGRIKDSTGVYTQIPYFKQGTNEVRPDSIRFNFDTQKALIWNSRTEQQAGLGSLGSDAMKVYADITKKENDSVYFLHEGKLTTSKDTVNPDYYIRIRKAKFVPKKKIIAGFSNIYIADVPTPIALPFAYFPLTVGRTAGLIMPTFGNDPNRGYFLQNGGYYIPINDHVDLNLTGDFYTNGSYGFRGESVYIKRYKFRGNINFSFENILNSQKGFDDFSRNTSYQIRISHSQDPKSNPNSRFSASVNLGSNNVFTNSLNQINTPNILNNNLSSSISYSKTFPAYPSVNLSLSATHNQNISAQNSGTDVENINLTLPTLTASMERIFPFAKRDGIKKGVIQNINFQYDVNASNTIRTSQDDFLSSRMFKNAKVGAKHRLPLSTNLKVAKYFSVSLGGTYEDNWTLETFRRRFDTEENEVVRDTIKGFDRFNKYSLNASITTNIYGTFTRGEDKKIQAIRHVMRPSISYGYAPSFEQFYDSYLDANGEMVQYSRFEGTLNGAPSLNKSNSLSLSIANTLEAKVRSKDSTDLEPKKISLLKNFTVSTGYNFESDSLKLSPLRVSGGTAILKEKMAINFSANLDPYAIDNNGKRINTFNIDNGGSLLRLTGANANVSYSLSSKDFDKNAKKEDKEENNDFSAASGGRADDLFGRADNFSDRRTISDDSSKDNDDKETELYGNKLPWDLRLAYTVSYINSQRQNDISNNSLMFSGNIELTPKWKVGASSGYDFKGKGFTLTQLRFERDLDSFRINFNWTPFGNSERWFFFIGIKSSILSDLKWENRSQPRRR